MENQGSLFWNPPLTHLCYKLQSLRKCVHEHQPHIEPTIYCIHSWILSCRDDPAAQGFVFKHQLCHEK